MAGSVAEEFIIDLPGQIELFLSRTQFFWISRHLSLSIYMKTLEDLVQYHYALGSVITSIGCKS